MRYLLVVLWIFMGCSDNGTKASSPVDMGLDQDALVDMAADTSATDAGVDTGSSPTCEVSTGAFPRRLSLPNSEPNGVFDPSLALDPNTQRLWMSYSGVTGPAGSGAVSTHLAYSDDRGQTWCDFGVVNASQPEPNPPAAFAGRAAKWHHETSSIVYDPAADAQARWRLVWMQYLHIEDDDPATEDRHFEYGWIAQRTAATAEGLVSAPATKLFGGLPYYSPGVEAYNEAVPGGSPAVRWDNDPTLQGCLVFAEPGLLAVESKLWMAVVCARSMSDTSVELIELDHATNTWSARSTLLTPFNGAQINAAITGFNAPDLFTVGNTVHLLISPVVAQYAGCLGYTVDTQTGLVVDLDGNGPDVIYGLEATEGALQTGACTYHEASELGVIYGDTLFSGVQFQLFATGTTF
ncbi:MAG: sialidase family protein [bacterium]